MPSTYQHAETKSLLQNVRSIVGDQLSPLKEWLVTDRLSIVAEPQNSQRWWGEQVVNAQIAGLPTLQPSARDCIRIGMQLSSSLSSAWMAAPPIRSMGLALDTGQYRTLLCWHLGVPLLPGNGVAFHVLWAVVRHSTPLVTMWCVAERGNIG